MPDNFSTDAAFADLEASGDLKVIEIDDQTKFPTITTTHLFAMLRGHVLQNLPSSVRDDIVTKEAAKTEGRA